MRHIVLILGLFLIGAALQGGHHLASSSAAQDWPASGIDALAPELVLRSASRSEPAVDPGSDETPDTISARSAQNATHSRFCAWGRDMRPDCPDNNHGNPARAPPSTG